MSGRQSYSVMQAIESVKGGMTLSAAARLHGCHVRSVRRAINRKRSQPYPLAPGK
jgi:hypothetical protein